MLVRVKKHPTLGILVASNGMVYTRTRDGSHQYKWTFGSVNKKQGYSYIRRCGKNLSVHRIVAETFLDNPEQKPWIDHISRDRLDNNVCNLRWCTPTENHLNMETSTGFGELSSIDKNEYHRVLMKSPKHYEKHLEADKQAYRKRREAGFHRVIGLDGKRVWVHESELEAFFNGDIKRINRILTEDSPNPRVAKNLVRASLGTV